MHVRCPAPLVRVEDDEAIALVSQPCRGGGEVFVVLDDKGSALTSDLEIDVVGVDVCLRPNAHGQTLAPSSSAITCLEGPPGTVPERGSFMGSLRSHKVMVMAPDRRTSTGPDAASVGWLLAEAVLVGGLLGITSWVVSAVLNGGFSPEPVFVFLFVAGVTALVGALFALGAACAGLAMIRVVDPRRSRPRLRLAAGAVAGGVVTWLSARLIVVPELSLPAWLPVVAGVIAVGSALVLLLRYERRGTNRSLGDSGRWPGSAGAEA